MLRKIVSIILFLLSVFFTSKIFYLNLFEKENVSDFFRIDSLFSFIALSVLFPLGFMGLREIALMESNDKEKDLQKLSSRLYFAGFCLAFCLIDAAYLSLR